MVKTIGAPMVLSATYPDGLRGKTGEWKKMVEANKLEIERTKYRRGSEDRNRINQQIKDLRKI
jgi:hypothetical protein